MRRLPILGAGLIVILCLGAVAPALAAGSAPGRVLSDLIDPGLGRASEVAPAMAGASLGDGYRELSGLAYGTGAAQVEDVYIPNGGSGPFAGVVVIHGGAWSSGGRSDMAAESVAIARAGMVAINVDYRLDTAKVPGFPEELTDVEAALRWSRSNASLLDLDPSRVGALGASAGGNLALELGVAHEVASVVSWSAPTDLAAFELAPYSPCRTEACGPMSMPYAVYRYLGCVPRSCPGLYRAASPATQVEGSGSSYMVWNSDQELIPQSQSDAFAAAARRGGARVTEEVVTGHRHAAQYMGRALAPSVTFLAAALG